MEGLRPSKTGKECYETEEEVLALLDRGSRPRPDIDLNLPEAGLRVKGTNIVVLAG